MPKVVREGDKNDAGGKVIKGDKTFLVDGKPVSVIGSPVSAHKPFKKPHKPDGTPKTSEGTKTFMINGKRVNVVGDHDTCKHVRIQGSSTFIVSKE